VEKNKKQSQTLSTNQKRGKKFERKTPLGEMEPQGIQSAKREYSRLRALNKQSRLTESSHIQQTKGAMGQRKWPVERSGGRLADPKGRTGAEGGCSEGRSDYNGKKMESNSWGGRLTRRCGDKDRESERWKKFKKSGRDSTKKGMAEGN